MKRRLISAVLAAGILVSFASCDLLSGSKPTETTISETTEETTEVTTAETTTSEETTTEETTTSEETTVTSEETSSETTTPPAPSDATSKKTVKKSSVPSIPKGYKKVSTGWGKKHNGHVVYIVRSKKSSFEFKGWWKNKWIKLEYDVLGDDDGEVWYNDKYCSDYYQYMK